MSGTRTQTLQVDSRALQRYVQGMTYQQIADAEQCSEQTAHIRVRRAIRNQYRLEADELRVVADEQLSFLTRQLTALIHKKSYKIAPNGKIAVHPETGEPLEDYSEQRMTALALLKVGESRRKLLGLDQPVKHRVEITDKMDSEIERLAQDLAANGAGEPVLPELPAGVTSGDGD
jgi:hypothetical protein